MLPALAVAAPSNPLAYGLGLGGYGGYGAVGYAAAAPVAVAKGPGKYLVLNVYLVYCFWYLLFFVGSIPLRLLPKTL